MDVIMAFGFGLVVGIVGTVYCAKRWGAKWLGKIKGMVSEL
jgi:hypothetical protein